MNGQDVTTYDAFAAFMGSADAGTAAVVFDRQGYRYETQVTTPATLPANGYSGFLGVGPEVQRDRLNPLAAVGEAGSSFGSTVKDSVTAIGNRFSPSGITSYVDTVTSASSNDESTDIIVRPSRRSTRSRPMRPMPSPRRAPAVTTTVSCRSSASSAWVRRPPTAAPSPSCGCW